MHAQLPITEAVHLMGSDVVEGLSPPVVFGGNFHISVVGKDKAEADRAVRRAQRGAVESPHASRQRAVGTVLRHVRRPLRDSLDGEFADAGLTRVAPRTRNRYDSHNEGAWSRWGRVVGRCVRGVVRGNSACVTTLGMEGIEGGRERIGVRQGHGL